MDMGSLSFFFVIVAISIFRLSMKKGAEQKSAEKKDGKTDYAEAAKKFGASVKKTVSTQEKKLSAELQSSQLKQKMVQRKEDLYRQWGLMEDTLDADDVGPRKTSSDADRLESMKILHEAGILDDFEYAQRVAKIRAGHHS